MQRLLAVVAAVLLSLIPAPAAPPEAPPPRPVLDPSLADWTPRPATGIAEEWEKAIEANWVDGRFRAMDTGPFLNCSMRYPLGKDQPMVYKATVVKLGDGGGVVFDRSTMRLAAGWTGGWLTHSDRRFGLMNTPTPKGEMVFTNPSGPGWAASDWGWDVAWGPTRPLPADWVKYRGLYVHGDRVVFSYRVDQTEVLEAFGIEGDRFPIITRSIERAKSKTEHQAAQLRLPTDTYEEKPTPSRKRSYYLSPSAGEKQLAFAVRGYAGG